MENDDDDGKRRWKIKYAYVRKEKRNFQSWWVLILHFYNYVNFDLMICF